MEYKYKTYTEVYEEDECTFIEDGVEKKEDLMITYWVPDNFSDETFNYLLRKNHSVWTPMHNKFFQTIERKWITNLGFSEQYFFEEISRVDENNETIVTNNLVKLDLGLKREIETDQLINKHNEPDTLIESL